MHYFTSLLGLLTAFGVASAAPSSPTVDLSQVHITNVKWGGSGCPDGSVTPVFSPDNETMTLIFDNWTAQWWVSPAASRENCQLNVEFEIPFGLTFWVTSIDHRGYADLDEGCTGDVTTTYYFSGEQQQATTNLQLTGPFDDNYLKTDTAIGFAAVTCPCGTYALLNINAAISTTCKTKDEVALMTVDSEDQKWTQVFHLGWSTCH